MARRTTEHRKTAADRVYLEIRRGIVAGAYPVAERLTEGSIAERMEVSRTPVREALQRLAKDGFVEFTPHSGALVKSWSKSDVREVFEVRAQLEGMAARLAAQNAKEEDIVRLTAMCDEMETTDRETAEGLSLVSELNKTYHTDILRLADNKRLQVLALNLMDLGFLVRSYGTFGPKQLARSFSDHRLLTEAMRLHDALWAEAIMRSHILAAASIFTGTDAGAPARPTGRKARAPRRTTS